MTFDATRQRRLLENKAAEIRKKGHLPEELIDLVAKTAALQIEARDALAEPKVETPGPAELERVLRGAPLLERERFFHDVRVARDLFDRLLDLVEQSGGHLAEAGQTVRKAVAGGELEPETAFARHVAGDEAFFREWEERLPQAPRLVAFLTMASLAPCLEALGERLYRDFPKDRTWGFGHCPACGSAPLLSRLLEKEGKRHLTCSFCHLEYRAKRLMCPYCGEEDQKKLEYFTAEEEPGYRVETCGACKTYLKTVDFRELSRTSLPLLDDLESLALDLAASNQGFFRPALSAWGF